MTTTDKPTVLVAHTRKGHGVVAVENRNGFHGKPLDDPEAAIAELGGLRDIRIDVAKPEARAADRTAPRTLELPRYEVGSEVATRKAYGDALAALGAARPDVVVLDGEVSNSTFAEIFANAHPDRYFEMYIAEQQLVAAAVGLQAVGWRPFISTFAAFFSRATMRMAAVSRATFSLCGSAGVSIGGDGPSEMALEDIAAFRAILEAPCFILRRKPNRTPRRRDGRHGRDLLLAHSSRHSSSLLAGRGVRDRRSQFCALRTRTKLRSSAQGSPC